MQGQIQTLATNAQQVRAPEMQGLGRGPAGAGFWLERRAQQSLSCRLTLRQELPPHLAHLLTPKDRRGLLEVGFTVCLLLACSRGTNTRKGGEVSRTLEESRVYVCACLTRGGVLTACLFVRLSFRLQSQIAVGVLALPRALESLHGFSLLMHT